MPAVRAASDRHAGIPTGAEDGTGGAGPVPGTVLSQPEVGTTGSSFSSW
jgi:hypothetical protein